MGQAGNRYLYVIAFFAVSYLFLRYLLPFVLPFVLALFLASLIEPVVAWFEARWRVRRALGAALVIFLLVAGSGLITLFLLVRLGTELLGLSSSLPALYLQITSLVEEIANAVGHFSASLPPSLKATLDQQLGSLYQLVQGILARVLGFLQGWIQALPNLVLIFLITAIATYFMSRDKGLIRRFLLDLAPPGWRSGLVSVKARLFTSLIGLIKAQGILVFLTFAATFLGLALLGSPYALSVAISSAVLDILPVLGPALIFIPWIVYLFLSGEIGLGLSLLLLWGGVTVVRSVAQANVIGGQLGLHPLATLLSLYLGIKVFGPVGFIYGPLVAIILIAFLNAGLLSSIEEPE